MSTGFRVEFKHDDDKDGDAAFEGDTPTSAPVGATHPIHLEPYVDEYFANSHIPVEWGMFRKSGDRENVTHICPKDDNVAFVPLRGLVAEQSDHQPTNVFVIHISPALLQSAIRKDFDGFSSCATMAQFVMERCATAGIGDAIISIVFHEFEDAFLQGSPHRHLIVPAMDFIQHVLGELHHAYLTVSLRVLQERSMCINGIDAIGWLGVAHDRGDVPRDETILVTHRTTVEVYSNVANTDCDNSVSARPGQTQRVPFKSIVALFNPRDAEINFAAFSDAAAAITHADAKAVYDQQWYRAHHQHIPRIFPLLTHDTDNVNDTEEEASKWEEIMTRNVVRGIQSREKEVIVIVTQPWVASSHYIRRWYDMMTNIATGKITITLQLMMDDHTEVWRTALREMVQDATHPATKGLVRIVNYPRMTPEEVALFIADIGDDN
jgi:hypothetical protein